MLGYISLVFCLFGAVTARTTGNCYAQLGQSFCGARCSMVPNYVETYFDQCREGLCCNLKTRACADTEATAWICGYDFARYHSLCVFRRRNGCDAITKHSHCDGTGKASGELWLFLLDCLVDIVKRMDRYQDAAHLLAVLMRNRPSK